MLTAVVFQPTLAFSDHPELMVLVWAAFLVAVLWTGLKLWSEVPPRYRGPLLAAFMVAALFTVRADAVTFMPWWPCTEDNWQWMEQNLGYYGAIWMWYGVYWCS